MSTKTFFLLILYSHWSFLFNYLFEFNCLLNLLKLCLFSVFIQRYLNCKIYKQVQPVKFWKKMSLEENYAALSFKLIKNAGKYKICQDTLVVCKPYFIFSFPFLFTLPSCFEAAKKLVTAKGRNVLFEQNIHFFLRNSFLGFLFFYLDFSFFSFFINIFTIQ